MSVRRPAKLVRSAARRWWLTAPLLAAGCTPLTGVSHSLLAVGPEQPAVTSALPPDPKDEAKDAKDETKESKDSPAKATPAKEAAAPPAAPPADALPIGLDTVLRLTDSQNAAVQAARARVEEAFAERDLADKKWIPDLYFGVGYFRHEGGIQLQEGPVIHSSIGSVLLPAAELKARIDPREIAFAQISAARQIWQSKGELSRINSEKLLDASSTYVDLLALANADAVSRDLLDKLRDLRDRARKVADVERVAEVEAVRLAAEVTGQEASLERLRRQSEGLSAKLAYLLGLDPATKFRPVDARLVAFTLVEPSATAEQLTARALETGPGVRELEGILSVAQGAAEAAAGPGRLLPEVQASLLDAGFAGGPGASFTYRNRLDFGIQARWNLSGSFTAAERQRSINARVDQAQLTYADLRGRLALGVREAHSSARAEADQLPKLEQQIEQARRSQELSELRLKSNIPGASYGEIALALRAVATAQTSYLQSMREYDKAQLRLLVLVGAVPGGADHHPVAPAGHP